MLMPQMHKKMMTATNLLSELAHALRRSIGDNGDQETSNQQNTNDPNTMEKTKEVSKYYEFSKCNQFCHSFVLTIGIHGCK